MKIRFEQVVSKETPLYSEVLSSLMKEHFDTIKDEHEQELDVKLLINGIETEPIRLNDIMNNIDKHIEIKAKQLLVEKYETTQRKVMKLNEQLDNIISELREYEKD